VWLQKCISNKSIQRTENHIKITLQGIVLMLMEGEEGSMKRHQKSQQETVNILLSKTLNCPH